MITARKLFHARKHARKTGGIIAQINERGPMGAVFAVFADRADMEAFRLINPRAVVTWVE